MGGDLGAVVVFVISAQNLVDVKGFFINLAYLGESVDNLCALGCSLCR